MRAMKCRLVSEVGVAQGQEAKELRNLDLNYGSWLGSRQQDSGSLNSSQLLKDSGGFSPLNVTVTLKGNVVAVVSVTYFKVFLKCQWFCNRN